MARISGSYITQEVWINTTNNVAFWTMENGVSMQVKDMTSSHLFNTINLLNKKLIEALITKKSGSNTIKDLKWQLEKLQKEYSTRDPNAHIFGDGTKVPDLFTKGE